MSGRLATLAFHKIGTPGADGWETWNLIPESVFEGFLDWLDSGGWHIIDLATALRGLDAPDSLPPKSALLTFDDGYRSMLTVVAASLERRGLPSVLFVPTEHVGGINTWDLGTEPEEPLCDWADLRELSERGVSIQSHAASHTTFSKLDLTAQTYELTRSKAALEAHVGTTVQALAFPYGDAGDARAGMHAVLAKLGYSAAFLYKGGVTDPACCERFSLTRVALGPDSDLPALLAAD